MLLAFYKNIDDYRYGFNGMEKDNEVKGNGNSYTTHFRQLDPRLGRWLSIDPKVSELPWQSPYCSMDNNPIWFNDPMGDKVIKTRGKGVSKKEFRKYKSKIRELKRNSESFKAMYKDFANDDEIFEFKLYKPTTKGQDGLTEKPWETESGNTIMNTSADSPSMLTTIAHEAGHAWRILHKLDVQSTSKPSPSFPSTFGLSKTEKDAAWKNYRIESAHTQSINNVNTVKTRKNAEEGAMHIGNIVISELKRSDNKYSSLKYQKTYPLGLATKPKLNQNGIMIQTIVPSTFSIRNKVDYYNKSINIHKEHNTSPIK